MTRQDLRRLTAPPAPLAPRRRRRGGAFIEDLLSLSVAAVAVIVAAYVYMPDVQRGVWRIANHIALTWFGFY